MFLPPSCLGLTLRIWTASSSLVLKLGIFPGPLKLFCFTLSLVLLLDSFHTHVTFPWEVIWSNSYHDPPFPSFSYSCTVVFCPTRQKETVGVMRVLICIPLNAPLTSLKEVVRQKTKSNILSSFQKYRKKYFPWGLVSEEASGSLEISASTKVSKWRRFCRNNKQLKIKEHLKIKEFWYVHCPSLHPSQNL